MSKNSIIYRIAGFVIILLGGCASAYGPNTGNNTPTKLIATSSAIYNQDFEKARVKIYRSELFARIVKFGREIENEVATRQLKLKLHALPTKVEHLNASYLPPIGIKGSPVITIQCQPRYEDCFIDSIEHEVGHHIYQNLDEGQKAKVDAIIARRLQEPDAQAFQEEVAQIAKKYEGLSKILSERIEPVIECQVLNRDLAFGEKFLKVLDKDGINFSPEQVNRLRQKAQEYVAYMPSCTKEHSQQAEENFSQIEQVMTAIASQIEQIYHQKKKGSDIEQLPDIDTNFPLKPVPPEKFKQFYQAGQEYIDAIRTAINEKMTQEKFAEESVQEQALIKLAIRVTLFNATRGLALSNLMLFKIKFVIGEHDTQAEEQFAAVIDSLADGYTGHIVTAPMRLYLNEPILQALEQLEYHGQRALVPLVEKYRAILKEKQEK